MDVQNTKIAFAHLSDKELKISYRLFLLTDKLKVYKIANYFPKFLVGFPLIKGLLKRTLFHQFVGGEVLEDLPPTIHLLQRSGVDVILDYGLEAQEDEDSLNAALEQFKRSVDYASQFPTVNWISIKLTALLPTHTLHAVSSQIDGRIFDFLRQGKHTQIEEEQWQKGMNRLEDLCTLAQSRGIGVMIDAEESWIQDAIDVLTMHLMQRFNTSNNVVVANTFQLYRKDKLQFLKDSKQFADEHQYSLGAKIVRGAYIEKEAHHALTHHKDNVLFPDKQSVDKAFDEGLLFCLQHIKEMSLIVATHNEQSIALAVKQMAHLSPQEKKRVLFSQLYGMGNHLTFNLADEKFHVAKYIPYGKMQEVFSYLMRRAKENSSIKGQASRELQLLRAELKRRRL